MKQENAAWMNRLLEELQEFLYKRGTTLLDNATIVEGNGYSGVVKIRLEIMGYLAESDSAPASSGKDGPRADCPCQTCRFMRAGGPGCPRMYYETPKYYGGGGGGYGYGYGGSGGNGGQGSSGGGGGSTGGGA
jgi:uncharacterized membrane protein YgcG